MRADMESDGPVNELVLSFRWTTAVREIDGTSHVILRLEHPRFGALDFLMHGNQSMDLAAALAKSSEARDEARMRSTVPSVMERSSE